MQNVRRVLQNVRWVLLSRVPQSSEELESSLVADLLLGELLVVETHTVVAGIEVVVQAVVVVGATAEIAAVVPIVVAAETETSAEVQVVVAVAVIELAAEVQAVVVVAAIEIAAEVQVVVAAASAVQHGVVVHVAALRSFRRRRRFLVHSLLVSLGRLSHHPNPVAARE